MKLGVRFFTAFLILLFSTSCSPAGTLSPDAQTVRHVSDGDSFILADGRKVRMIGVDTPETHDEARNRQNAKRNAVDHKKVQTYAAKAKAHLADLIEGQTVRLEYDWQAKDKFGRTLAYVYRSSDNLFVNEEMVRQGYGFAYLQFPFKYSKQFEAYASESRKNKRGLWS